MDEVKSLREKVKEMAMEDIEDLIIDYMKKNNIPRLFLASYDSPTLMDINVDYLYNVPHDFLWWCIEGNSKRYIYKNMWNNSGILRVDIH